MALVVGIAGASCAGKTTLSKRLQAELHGDVRLLHLDDFYFEEVIDWEIPESLDFDRLVAKIDSIKTAHRDQRDVPLTIIVEGFLLFSNAELWRRFDAVFFLLAEEKSCRQRRIARDRWVALHPDYFDNSIWPQYLLQNRAILERVSLESRDGVCLPFTFSVGNGPLVPVHVFPSTDPLDAIFEATKKSIVDHLGRLSQPS